MAIAIMGGLVTATILTLFFVPALYAAWTSVPRERVTEPKKTSWGIAIKKEEAVLF
jgi:Flp pilus assembly protein protease CpaA